MGKTKPDIARLVRALENAVEFYKEDNNDGTTKSLKRFQSYVALLDDGKLAQKEQQTNPDDGELDRNYAYVAVVIAFLIRDFCCRYYEWRTGSLAVRFLYAIQGRLNRLTIKPTTKEKLLDEIRSYILCLYDSTGRRGLDRKHVDTQLNTLYRLSRSFSCLMSVNEQCDHVLMVYDMLA